jgi:ribosome-associated protein
VTPRQRAKSAAKGSFLEYVCTLLAEKRAEDVLCLDVSGVTDLADHFVIATILNARQGAAILEECEKERKKRGVGRIGIEGASGSSWIVLDYGDLVVHLLQPAQRTYYGLEHLWADAKRVTVPQAAGPT